MWWRDEQAPFLFDAIERLVEEWRSGNLPAITAIGSTWDAVGQRVLFVGVEPEHFADGIAEARGGRPFDVPRTAARSRWIPIERIQHAVGIDGSELPSGGLAAPVGRMRQLAGYTLLEGARIGSLGCGLITAGGQFGTTAGHAVTPGEDLVWRRKRGLFGPTRMLPAGHVMAATSPRHPDVPSPGSSGVDLGLLYLDIENAPKAKRTLTLVEPRNVGVHHRCRWSGGRSGPHRGFVVASCNVYNDPAEPYFHSYFLNGDLKTFAGMEGDSGSIVTDEGGAALGHLIGVDGYGDRGLFQSAWVQDAHTALAYATDKLGQLDGLIAFS